MDILIKPGLAEVANVGITQIAVILNQIFKKYDQPSSVKDAEVLSSGQVIMPIMAFEAVPLYLKSSAAKGKHVTILATLSVYSKQPDDPRPCSSFILPERHKEDIWEDAPTALRDATFKSDSDETLQDLFINLSSIPAEKISYFYNTIACEGTTYYGLAVIHEFGKVGDPYCVCTSYFKVEVAK